MTAMYDWNDIDPQDQHRLSSYAHEQHLFEGVAVSAINQAISVFIRRYLPWLLDRLQQVVPAVVSWIRQQLGYRTAPRRR